MDKNIFHGYGTDKEDPHNYSTSAYYDLFTPIADRVTSVLEIGVFTGESLRAWRDFFPQASVVGLDCHPMAGDSERIRVVAGDQGSPGDLRRLGEDFGPFDLVIDDGSHQLKHQLTSLLYLWQFIRPGGMYIIEDIANKQWVEVLGAMPGSTHYFTGDLDDDFLLVMVKE